MPTETGPRYSLAELADLAGVTVRTVRYYISQGLLAVDVSPGPGPKYDDSHLARLRLIRRLQGEHQPLAEIRHRLEGLSDDDVFGLVAAPEAPPPDSALDYIRALTRPSPPAREMPALYSMASPDVALLVPTESAAPMANPEPVQRVERSQWERIEIAPDIEIHVRRPLSRQAAKQVDRLIAIARDLFAKEHQP